jgi:arginase
MVETLVKDLMATPCIGLASGIGAGNLSCGEGPIYLRTALKLPQIQWGSLIQADEIGLDKLTTVMRLNRLLAQEALLMATRHPFFLSLGGDHSSAIGLWSGIAESCRKKGDIGLLWIDAHMDAHTPQTSESGNIHGMPLAALLGYGDSCLTQLFSSKPKIKPKNVALIGIRSFESEEEKLLSLLGVRIYFMQEVRERGLAAVMREAIELVSRNTVGYGVSFDLDSLDPYWTSAVGTPVPGGLDFKEFLTCCAQFKEAMPTAR